MRSYGDKFLLQLKVSDPNRLGVQLGRLCIDANLPALYVSKVLEVSKTTIYAWFRGQYIREENRKTIEAFMNLVRKDMEQGILPARNNTDAKLYLTEMVGRSL